MTNSQLIQRVLVEGAVGALVLVIIAFLLSRFTRDIIGHSLLVIFLFTAAGAYFGFVIGQMRVPVGYWENWHTSLFSGLWPCWAGAAHRGGLLQDALCIHSGTSCFTTSGRTIICSLDLCDCLH